LIYTRALDPEAPERPGGRLQIQDRGLGLPHSKERLTTASPRMKANHWGEFAMIQERVALFYQLV